MGALAGFCNFNFKAGVYAEIAFALSRYWSFAEKHYEILV